MVDGLKIAEVTIENYLAITQMTLKPRPGMNIYEGKNSQAKTDIIRAIKDGLKGVGVKAIQHGKDKATLLINISDGHIIKSHATKEGSESYRIQTPDGDDKKAPKTFIKSLLGDVDFEIDPVEFALRKDKKAYIMQTFDLGRIDEAELAPYLNKQTLARLDFKQDGLTVCKEAEKIVYTARAERNRQVEEKDADLQAEMKRLGTFNRGEYDPEKTVALKKSLEETRARLIDATAANKSADDTKDLRHNLRGKIEAAKALLIDRAALSSQKLTMENEFHKMQIRLEALTLQMQEINHQMSRTCSDIISLDNELAKDQRRISEIEELSESFAQLPEEKDLPDVATIETELALFSEAIIEAELQDKMFADYEKAQVIQAEVQKLKKDSAAMTALLEKLRVEIPEKILKKAELPFESLEFDGDDIKINGTYLSNMSTAEQLFAIIQIYHRRNKNAKLKVIFCDRLESLDDESYETFWKFAIEHGYQVFGTKVASAHIQNDVLHVEHGTIKETL